MDFNDENVLKILYFLSLSLFVIEDFFLYCGLDVFGNHDVFLLFDCFHLTIVDSIGICKASSSKRFLDLLHIYLAYSFIVETIPAFILERFNIRIIVAMPCTPAMY